PAAGGCRDVAAPVEEPADEVHRPDARDGARWPILRRDVQHRQERHHQLQGVHLHAVGAFEAFVAGDRRRLDAVTAARAADQHREEHQLRDGEQRDEIDKVHGASASVHTASSLPPGSRKWKRRPPGKANTGFTISPPAASTLANVASSASLYRTTSALPRSVRPATSARKNPPSRPASANAA